MIHGCFPPASPIAAGKPPRDSFPFRYLQLVLFQSVVLPCRHSVSEQFNKTSGRRVRLNVYRERHTRTQLNFIALNLVFRSI